MPATLLFVYGSLLSEVPSAMSLFLRTHSQGFEPLYLPGKLYDLGYYPGFVHLPQASTLVYGEVHQLLDADKALRELDAYERPPMDLAIEEELDAFVARRKAEGGAPTDF